MTLATRCTSCTTVFRVVQDQLKVSEGWVRCGRCGEVFNALDGLFDLEAQAAATAELAPMPAEPAKASADPPPWPKPVVVEPVAEPEPTVSIAMEHTPAARVDARDRNEFADAQFNTSLLADDGVPPSEDATAEPPAVAPAFLRDAEREARWQRPRRVFALAIIALGLAAALVGQATVHFRDLIVATAPGTRPAMGALCDAVGCQIEPLRRIDDVLVESSALTSAPAGDAFRLSVVLRNRGALPLAMPSVELTLTDAGGQTLARRALSPAEFRVRSATLAPAAETPIELVLSTGGRKATGYTVEPFYP